MSDPQPPEQPPPPTDARANRPRSALDTVLAADGPMPAARLGLRGLAFLMDFILVTFLATFLIWQILLPRIHPGSSQAFGEWSREFVEWISEGGDADPPEIGHQLNEALVDARDLQVILFWIYFALCEVLIAGGSLGKKTCRLRTISTVNLESPNILTAIVRGGLKTAALFFLFPLLFAASLGALFFNRRGQTGHDLLSRTAVIDERRSSGFPPAHE